MTSYSEFVAPRVTALVITYNEAVNLARCLDRLAWAERVLIVDSGSTDATLAIAQRYPNVDVVQRPFDSFAEQCNYGLSCIETPWVLSLDADYELSAELERELGTLRDCDFVAFEASFIYRIYGRSLRSTLYPARRVLYLREHARYKNVGHGHHLTIEGPVARLKGKIYHDDRKPLSRWLSSQRRYADQEAEFLLTADARQFGRADRVRRMAWPAPVAVFLYTLFWKRCLLDGWAGWLYVLQRTLAETMIALAIVDRKLAGDQGGANEASSEAKTIRNKDENT